MVIVKLNLIEEEKKKLLSKIIAYKLIFILNNFTFKY